MNSSELQSKFKIGQKHILHQFPKPNNVNLRVIIVPSVIVFTANREGLACSLNPHQSGDSIGWMFAEELDVVHGTSLFNNGFQPDKRAEKSNKNQKCFNIHYENIHCRPLYCQRPLWVWFIRGATAPPLSCHQGAVKNSWWPAWVICYQLSFFPSYKMVLQTQPRWAHIFFPFQLGIISIWWQGHYCFCKLF